MFSLPFFLHGRGCSGCSVHLIIENRKVPDAANELQVRIIGNHVRIMDDPVAVYAEHFFLPDGSHCENGKTNKCDDAKSEDLPFCSEL